MKETELKVYAARNPSTGKLVSDITSPHKKFWQRKDACREAINRAVSGRFKSYKALELVTFKLVEVQDEN